MLYIYNRTEQNSFVLYQNLDILNHGRIKRNAGARTHQAVRCQWMLPGGGNPP